MSAFHPHSVRLSLEQARTMVRAAIDAARERELKPMIVVVLDGGGHPVALEREDGAGIARFEIARGKAWVALGVGMASGAFGAANQDRPAFLGSVSDATGGRAVPVGGGVPVLDEAGEIIGAVGVSGDTSEADEDVAVAGVEASGLRAGVS